MFAPPVEFPCVDYGGEECGSQGGAEPIAGGGKEYIFVKLRDATSEDTCGFVDAGGVAADDTSCDGLPVLSDAELQALYQRIDKSGCEPINGDGAELKRDFAMRDASAPPPVSGERLPNAFPPPPEVVAQPMPNSSDDAPFGVVRSTPTGSVVGLAPHISMTFSHPMVAIGTVADVQAQARGVMHVEPAMEGRYRWLGTQTLVFEPAYRMAQSTKFTYTVSAGTKDYTGHRTLAADFVGAFDTPTLAVLGAHPRGGAVHCRPILFASFNQRVDPAALLPFVELQPKEGAATEPLALLSTDQVAVRMASDGFYLKSPGGKAQIERLLAEAPEGRCMWFAPAGELPTNTSFRACLRAGAPSAEGPRRTEKQLDIGSFATFAPLEVERHDPVKESLAAPMTPLSITFNNAILRDTIDSRCISVEPELQNMRITAPRDHVDANVARSIAVEGVTEGETEYTVTLDVGVVEDIYGQRFAKPKKLVFHIGPAAQSFVPLISATDYVLDPSGAGCEAAGGMVRQESAGSHPVRFSIGPHAGKHDASYVTTNVGALRFVAYHVSKSHYKSFHQSDWRWRHRKDHVSELTRLMEMAKKESFKLVADSTIIYAFKRDSLTQVNVDLLPLLQHPASGLGQLVVCCQPVLKDRTKGPADGWLDKPGPEKVYGRESQLPCHSAWVQATNLALSIADHALSKASFAWVTDLRDGALRPGASVEGGKTRIGTTDANGAVPLACGCDLSPVVVVHGEDVLIGGHLYTTEHRSPSADFFVHAFTDRDLYKPKEAVRAKGVFRLALWNPNFTLRHLEACPPLRLTWTALDGRGVQISKGEVQTSATGSWEVKFDLPDNVATGMGSIAFQEKKGSVGLFSCSGEKRLKSGRPDFSTTVLFKVQEFRKPEFEVSCTPPDAEQIVGAPEAALVKVGATYYAGGGITNADVKWTVCQAPGHYAPPAPSEDPSAWEGYSWQEFEPYFWARQDAAAGGAEQRHAAKTSSVGEHTLAVEHRPNGTARPVALSCECVVQDITRQTMHASAAFTVHPSALYVGMRGDKCSVKPGLDFPLHVCAAGIGGAPAAGAHVRLLVTREEWEVRGLDQVQVTKGCAEVDLVMDEKGKGSHTLTFASGGEHHVVARVVDTAGRVNETKRRVWVYGGQAGAKQKVTNISAADVEIFPDREEYRPGDVAEVTVSSPFDAEQVSGWLLFSANCLLHKERFAIYGAFGSYTASFQILEEHVPGLECRVELAGADSFQESAGKAAAAKVPAFASGTVRLRVSNLCKCLKVSVSPEADKLPPGGSTNIRIDVTGERDQRPVEGAEVTVWVVDEAVLALAGYDLPAPVSFFYPPYYSPGRMADSTRPRVYLRSWEGVRPGAKEPSVAESDKEEEVVYEEDCEEGALEGNAYRNRRSLVPMPVPCSYMAAPVAMACVMMPPQMDCAVEDGANLDRGTGGAEAPLDATAAIAVRTSFDSLALWRADLQSDTRGHVEEVVVLPDSLTKYRIFAYAHCAATHVFGKGEGKIQVTQPMSLRLSLPRFLNFGDECLFSAVVQNLTAADAVINAGCRMLNLAPRGPLGWRVDLRPGQRKELRFTVAAMEAGEVRFQVGGSIVKGGGASLGFGDAEERRLPVWTPATSEAFATYGEVDDDGGVVVQGLKPPADVWPQFGALEVSTSSTILQALTDAVVYLYQYPYECCEQTASKIIALLAMRDVLQAFQSPGLPAASKVDATIRSGLKKLVGCQRGDGAYGWWRPDSDPSPYLTLHVAFAFGMVKQKDPQKLDSSANSAIRRLLPWVEHAERLCAGKAYQASTVRELRAYSCYVLAKLGHAGKAVAIAEDLWKTKDQLSWEAMAWLAFSLHSASARNDMVAEILAILKARVNETAETAHFVTEFRDDGEDQLVLLRSSRRTDGVVLEALLAVEPKQPLAVKMVKGLLKHKKKGRWSNTQECCYILIALDAYFHAHEGEPPDFVARAWVDRDCILQDTFQGREAKTHLTSVPMAALCAAAAEGFEVPGGEPDRAIVIQKQGRGRLYYRLGLTYAPRDLKLAPSDQGFAVDREYAAVGDPAQVVPLAGPDGPGYRIRLGSSVKVTLTIALRSRRYHVALVDKLPAGLEPVNPELQGGAGMEKEAAEALGKSADRNPGRIGFWWNPRWYEHENLRDERVEVFGGLVWEGVHMYSYIARATAAGTFVAPPATAEEMYSPEVFGRTGTMKVIVA